MVKGIAFGKFSLHTPSDFNENLVPL